MLETKFLNLNFKNPIILASGILGVTAASLNNCINNGCGGVTIKSVSIEKRGGHPNPTMLATDNYFLNAVGLSNPGIHAKIKEIKKFKEMTNSPIIGSVFAGTPDEFAEITEIICDSPIDLLELNISCPNVSKEFGTPFAYSKEAIEIITKKVKEKSSVPISVKLSPNAWNIAELAKVAEASGADAITATNTMSGMAINIQAKSPILHNKQGGISGPALFPVSLNSVYQIYKSVKIPIIGTGGITKGENALAMIMAGATLLGVGSAVYYRGQDVFKKITNEMEKIMKEENIKSLEEIRGVANN
jgi:dihydroorotate dehydrogenase (NAD+) catalytic subunit